MSTERVLITHEVKARSQMVMEMFAIICRSCNTNILVNFGHTIKIMCLLSRVMPFLAGISEGQVN